MAATFSTTAIDALHDAVAKAAAAIGRFPHAHPKRLARLKSHHREMTSFLERIEYAHLSVGLVPSIEFHASALNKEVVRFLDTADMPHSRFPGQQLGRVAVSAARALWRSRVAPKRL